MNESQLPSKWFVLGRVLLDLITRHAPSFLLKRWFPVAKCQKRIELFANGVGPHLYVNPGRPAAVSHLKLWCYNYLPFEIWLDGIELEIQLGDQGLARVSLTVRDRIYGYDKKPVVVSENYLTDSQAERVRQYPSDSAVLKITGRTWIKSPVGDFEKQLDQLETRAFIYRGEVPT